MDMHGVYPACLIYRFQQNRFAAPNREKRSLRQVCYAVECPGLARFTEIFAFKALALVGDVHKAAHGATFHNDLHFPGARHIGLRYQVYRN